MAGGLRATRVARKPSPIENVRVLTPKSFADARNAAETKYWEAEATKSAIESAQLTLELSEYKAAVVAASNSNKRNRVYDFTGIVSKTTAEECIEHVSAWARTSKETITVIFNSPGGEVVPGLALFDFLRAVDKYDAPITTVAYGMAASMGAVLMQAGRRRVAGPNSFFLIHEVEGGALGSRSEVEDKLAWLDTLNDRLLKLMTERASITDKEIRAKSKKRDWWISAEEAVSYGFADEIGLR